MPAGTHTAVMTRPEPTFPAGLEEPDLPAEKAVPPGPAENARRFAPKLAQRLPPADSSGGPKK